MDKKTFQKKWHFQLLQVIFVVSFIFFAIPGVWAILYEDDMPFMGIVWIVVLAVVYWFAKRIFYHVMFKDKIIPSIR